MASSDMQDTVELDKERRLYLKSISRMVILVQLPDIKIPGTTISNWEIMEKLKKAVCPNVFSYLKVTKTTTECILFEAEAESKDLLSKFVNNLDGKVIKLSGFSEAFKVKAGKAKLAYPKKHDWVAFFRDSKDKDESKPGERPDTMHIKGLPIKWFLGKDNGNNAISSKPCQRTIHDIFQQFGEIRVIDIPILDPYRKRMKLEQSYDTQVFKTFSFGSNLYFDVYIQFVDYKGFEKAMQMFKGKKLVHLLDDDKSAAINVEVDFEKTGFLSAKNIEKRDREREKLIRYDLEQEEIARKIKEKEEIQRELERLAELRREEERKRKTELENEKKEYRRKIREQRKKLKFVKKKILYREKKRQAKINDKKRMEVISLRQKQAECLVEAVLGTISKSKREEKKEQRKREKELRMLHELEAKKLKKEEELREQNKIEDERKQLLEKQEKNLRLKLLKSLKEIEESKQEKERELLRNELGKKKIVSVVVCKNAQINDGSS
eukprot:gene7025-7813_t